VPAGTKTRKEHLTMQQLIVLGGRPRNAVTANQARDINIELLPPDVMLRVKGVLDFLGLGRLSINLVANAAIIPNGMPHAFMPHPQQLLAAMGKRLSPTAYSEVCLRLLDRYGDTMSDYLRGKLGSGLVKHDPMNVKGWAARTADQPDGTINVYEVGVSPITRFAAGGDVFNLSARAARKPLVEASAVPGGLLEWAITFAIFPEIKGEIVRTDPWIVHPGSRVRYGAGGWADVSGCDEWSGHADCNGRWRDDNVNPRDALFALL